MTRRRVLIIGNGIAGRTAALAARRADSTAEVRILGNEGERTYSPCALPLLLSNKLEPANVLLPRLERSLGIDILGDFQATEINCKEQRVYSEKGDCFSYDSLILALGGKPRRIFFKDTAPPEGLFHFKTLGDALKVKNHCPAKVAVVGAGLVGVEAAAALVEAGVKVTLIEAKEQILPNVLDQKPAKILEKILVEHGLDVFTGEMVKEILTSRGKISGLLTSSVKLECDTLIVAAGIVPETDLASRSGIEIGKLGAIRVDNRMQTSDKNVFTCGDCAESYDLLLNRTALHPLWPVAKMQGEVAGSNAAGSNMIYRGTISMTATNLFGVPVGSMGLSTVMADGDLSVEEVQTISSYRRLLYAGGKLVGVQGIGDLHWMSGLKQVIECNNYCGFVSILSSLAGEGWNLEGYTQKKDLALHESSAQIQA